MLPDKYKFSHEYCLFLYQRLVNSIESCESSGVFNHEFPLESDEVEEFKSLKSENLFIWLEQHGYQDTINILYYKKIIPALLTDFLHFIYEALECSRKGKLTVCYALLRKPLKENLFYLEWLLANPEGFMKSFDKGELKELKINQVFKDEMKVKIIEEAQLRTEKEKWIDPRLLYSLRYDKKANHGFEQGCQKATHLITTFKFLETEQSNFNFVFSDNKALDSQWAHIYSFLPMLLFHTIQVSEALISNIAVREDSDGLIELRTLIGFAFWVKDSPLTFGEEVVVKAIEQTLQELKVFCDNCNNRVKFESNAILELYERNAITCKCGHTNHI